MTTRLRSVLFLLVASLAAVALSACGGDGKTASADSDVNQLLKDTFTGNKKVKSGRFALALAVDAQGGTQKGPINVKLSGPFQSQGAKKLPKFKLGLDFAGSGQNLKAGLTSTGDKGFVNFNGTDYAVSDQVFKQFVAGYEQAQKTADAKQNGKQPSLTTLGIDPRKWLTNAKNAGEAKVGGEDTIKITGGVDVPKLLDDVNTALGKASSLGLQNSGQLPQKLTDQQRTQIGQAVKNLKVEIYTGKADTILRRMLIDLNVTPPPGAKSGGITAAKIRFDLSLTQVNKDQTIAAPANTKPLDQLLQQFGGAGGLGALGGGSTPGAGSASPGDQAALKKYTDCITAAGSDTAKAQQCAKLLTP
jgi:hypothetical protein